MDKKNMYFQRSNGEYILLLENCTEKDGWKAAKDFMDDHNYTSYYTRIWNTQDGNTHYDVGSHTEFFIWGFVN